MSVKGTALEDNHRGERVVRKSQPRIEQGRGITGTEHDQRHKQITREWFLGDD